MTIRDRFAGCLLGAMLGAAAVPAHWLARLELRDTLAEVAADLCDCASWPRTDRALVTRLGQKYPAS